MNPPSHRPAGKRVALAMSSGPLRSRLRKMLEQQAVTVRIADDHEELSRLEEESDLVLVDRAFMDSVTKTSRPDETVKELDTEQTGVVVIREDDDPVDRARLHAAGVAHVVVADELSEEQLAETVRSLSDGEEPHALEHRGHEATPSLADFLSRNSGMQEFLDLVRRVVDADTPLLITGETGVGKERLARAIHAESTRAEAPFVVVNCGALPEQLLESELFGHEKGAFTGAEQQRKGHFEAAAGGTIFLDEIGEMPLPLQVKLLNVLQRHEIVRVGSSQPIRIDVRVIAATNRDLESAVRDSDFREDLYYRLSVIPLRVPPLSERPEDIPDLVGSLIHHFRQSLEGTPVRGISPAALEALLAHDWPGNVRELVNVIERAMLLGRGVEIGLDDLPEYLEAEGPVESAGRGILAVRMPDELPEEWEGKTLKEVREAAVAQVEKAYLHAVLRQTGGKVGETAEIAGLHTRSLYDKMRRYRLRKERYKKG